MFFFLFVFVFNYKSNTKYVFSLGEMILHTCTNWCKNMNECVYSPAQEVSVPGNLRRRQQRRWHRS